MTLRRNLTSTFAVGLLALVPAVSCIDYNSPTGAPPRVLATVAVTLAAPTIEVGELSAATAAGLDQEGRQVAIGRLTWSSVSQTIAAINPTTGAIFGISPGTTEISATADGKVGKRTITVVTAPEIRINEVQSFGEAKTGWLEFFNPTPNPVDMSGWSMVDTEFFGPPFTFPAGSVIAAGGFLVIEEANLPFGVDTADALHLFSKFGVQVDALFWATRPPTTLGRCPDGTGGLVTTAAPTKGNANAC